MTGYQRYESIKDSIRIQLILPSRMIRYEVQQNVNDDTDLHTIYFSKATRAIEMSVMTEDELVRFKEFWIASCDAAIETVRTLDAAATVALATGKPSKRLYRPDTKLLFFPAEGGVPDEWQPPQLH